VNLEELYYMTTDKHMPAYMLNVGDVFHHPSKYTVELYKVIEYKNYNEDGLSVKEIKDGNNRWTPYTSIVMLKK
jgi:hypothetical protein